MTKPKSRAEILADYEDRIEYRKSLGLWHRAVRLGGEPENEADHFIECAECGHMIDCRELSEVFYHEGPHLPPLKM
jgi:hypothetical protein